MSRRHWWIALVLLLLPLASMAQALIEGSGTRKGTFGNDPVLVPVVGIAGNALTVSLTSDAPVRLTLLGPEGREIKALPAEGGFRDKVVYLPATGVYGVVIASGRAGATFELDVRQQQSTPGFAAFATGVGYARDPIWSCWMEPGRVKRVFGKGLVDVRWYQDVIETILHKASDIATFSVTGTTTSDGATLTRAWSHALHGDVARPTASVDSFFGPRDMGAYWSYHCSDEVRGRSAPYSPQLSADLYLHAQPPKEAVVAQAAETPADNASAPVTKEVPTKPVYQADAATWGIYAQLAGKQGTAGADTYQLRWEWQEPGKVLLEHWGTASRVSHTNTLTLTGKPGELHQKSTALGRESIGTLQADGAVVFVGKGMLKLPTRVSIVDGEYRMERVKLRDGVVVSAEPDPRLRWKLGSASD